MKHDTVDLYVSGGIHTEVSVNIGDSTLQDLWFEHIKGYCPTYNCGNLLDEGMVICHSCLRDAIEAHLVCCEREIKEILKGESNASP